MIDIIKELHNTINNLLTSDSKIKELVKVISNTESNKHEIPCIIFQINNTELNDYLSLSYKLSFSLSVIAKNTDTIYDIVNSISLLIKAKNIKIKDCEVTTLLSENVFFQTSPNLSVYKIILYYNIYLQNTNLENINLENIDE